MQKLYTYASSIPETRSRPVVRHRASLEPRARAQWLMQFESGISHLAVSLNRMVKRSFSKDEERDGDTSCTNAGGSFPEYGTIIA